MSKMTAGRNYRNFQNHTNRLLDVIDRKSKKVNAVEMAAKSSVRGPCATMVTQYISTGTMEWREIELPCGSTGVDCERLMCVERVTKADKIYPQGWRKSPGDTCKHGTYVGDAYGPDYMCHVCELE